ncbi:LacI family DNA-binding transcriptional regulator [Achromobacter sp. GG226]|uniref:LacI family DNA-binding transcriptional regulator n=1 Tax=Verticiella alkaliphila TaxID=2779529 RepID=UPI001C0DB328|nr:LacI family DNA-binding transcriptional regulator [Verticiella sp. GG226]MBU4609342.1 LacI family DNA-binding transcriptional regulator [Verticiella sp. GG226]
MSNSSPPPADPSSDARARRRGRGHGGITLTDVARLAGVSPMSASRALNSPDQVSEQIRARVRAAVERTGYVANRVAGALASQRSRLVAAVVPSIAGPVFQDMVQSLIAELAASGYQLMLGQSGYGLQEEDALLEAIIGRRPDGVVLGGVVPSAAGRLRLRASGIPVVQTWDRLDDPIDMLVGFSHEAIATAVAHFLVARGHRQLAFVGGDHERALRRAAAFQQAAQQAAGEGKAVSAITEAVRAPAGVGSGREALRQILQRQPGTQAVFCSSDVLALGVLTEAQAQGRSVPGELAVIGFGDLHFAADIVPSLTTVHIDSQAIGRHAARFIVACAEGRRPADTFVDVGFTIIERDSA